MEVVIIVIGVALLEYIYFSILVGKARGEHGVSAPATSGNEIFERYYRVQMNTLELLVAFIPGIIMFSRFFSPDIAAGIGAVFIVGRLLYLKSYVGDPAKRSIGFALSFLPVLILVVGGIVGAVMKMMASPM